MVTKTYKCTNTTCDKFIGFFHELDSVNDELKLCPNCSNEVKRVFKPVGYSWKCQGFAGRGFDTAK